MIQLSQYGWNNFHQENLNAQLKPGLLPGRVISVKGFKYFMIAESGELEAELSGKLMYASAQDELPKVGDWVLYMPYEEIGYIIEVLPRQNQLERKAPGTKNERQVLAANIDFALVVQGLDRDFNLMRMDRYLVQLAGCGVKPLIVLNKADLVSDRAYYLTEIEKLDRACPVFFCSTLTGSGIRELNNAALFPGKTYILIGSSGVGKSSLLNALSGDTVRKTNAVSDFNAKGKHTTTTRDLFQLPNGSLMIDTPGMREFGLTAFDETTPDLFPGIEKFVSDCKFSDCRHVNEAGCAVIEAVNHGRLDAEVYESYLKLVKEQRRFEIKTEDKKRMGKVVGRMVREANAHRRKNKF